MRRAAIFFAVLAFMGCDSERKPGPRRGETAFWRVVSSDVSFSNCSDDPSFRDGVEPIAFDENTYIIYRVDDEGLKATALACESFDTSTCRPSESGVVFDVAPPELLFTRESRSPIGGEGCNLFVVENWLLTDKGETLDMEISHTMSLVDDDLACQRVEEAIVSQSPNGIGVQGCVVKHLVAGSLN